MELAHPTAEPSLVLHYLTSIEPIFHQTARAPMPRLIHDGGHESIDLIVPDDLPGTEPVGTDEIVLQSQFEYRRRPYHEELELNLFALLAGQLVIPDAVYELLELRSSFLWHRDRYRFRDMTLDVQVIALAVPDRNRKASLVLPPTPHRLSVTVHATMHDGR